VLLQLEEGPARFRLVDDAPEGFGYLPAVLEFSEEEGRVPLSK
jgi:hypothetical protein